MRILLSSFLLAGLAACNPSVGAPCVADTDCASNQFCQDGACAEVADTPADAGPVRGDECFRDFDCPAGQQCSNGFCEGESAADAGAGGDDECANDEDCGRTRGCYEGTCRSRCFNDSVCERQDPGTICMDDPNNRLGLCLPPECERADECPTNHDCNGGRCEEYTPCDNDGQCGAQAFCNDDGRCQDREDCLRDADCEDGQTCNDGFCYDVPSCAEGENCPDGTECVGGNCVDAICRSNDQCADGEVCTAGSCSRPEAIAPDKVLVVTPYGACDSGNAGACRLPLRVGEQVQLHAMALDVNGVGIPGLSFAWASQGAANISEAGLLTAAAAGTSLVTVTAMDVESRPVTATVVAAQPGRLRVVDDRGRAVAGARVAIDGAWLEGATGDDGSFQLALDDGEFSVSVFAENHDQVAVFGLQHSAASPFEGLIAIPQTMVGRSAGYTATVDFTGVRTQGSGDLGISGASLPDLLSFDLPGLVGDTFDTRVSIPGLGNQVVPIPGGITFRASQPIQLDVKSTVYARGFPGVRTAWSFAGRVDALGLIGRIQGSEDVGRVVAAILPQVESFDHGLIAGLNLSGMDDIIDVDDIDGDGNTTEVVANWRRFPSRSLRPGVRQNGRTLVLVPGAEGSEFQVVVGGVLNPGTGFVPLGLTSRDGAGAQSLPFAIAPAYGGLEGAPYAFATMALRDQGLTTQARVLTNSRLEVEQRFPAHLPVPTTVERSQLNNTVTMSPVAGAHLLRFVGVGPAGRVVVYAPPADAPVTFTPPIPVGEEAGARLTSVTFDGITLSPAASPADAGLMNRLLGGGAVVLRNVSQNATGFVRKVISPQ